MTKRWEDDAHITFTHGFTVEGYMYPCASHMTYWSEDKQQYEIVVLFCDVGQGQKENEVISILREM